MIVYKVLCASDISPGFFDGFIRTQVVSDCYRKVNGEWIIKHEPFIDDWSPEEYDRLIAYLKNNVESGGYVSGAFIYGKLKGFVSVEPKLFGTRQEYLDLSNIHVSLDMRGQGIGKHLFGMAKSYAKSHGAAKLYISAHSAVESQAFYKAMGCTEAMEYNMKLVKMEPFDCQLEYVL